MSEFSPFSAETSGMELAVTNSRIKDWRLNRRSAQSLLPAVYHRSIFEAVSSVIRKFSLFSFLLIIPSNLP